MLTLLKQARAFGLGVVLATQNPVDLDYKGLSNAGTWLLGRLQTERDKLRVLEGLEGASAAAGASFDRQKMEAILAGLGSRVFLMNNVHEDAPVVFQTRWALSYLRGPLTREQIQTLMRSRTMPASSPTDAPSREPTPVAQRSAAVTSARPILPPGVPEQFLPARRSTKDSIVYRPLLLGVAKVHYAQTTNQVDAWERVGGAHGERGDRRNAAVRRLERSEHRGRPRARDRIFAGIGRRLCLAARRVGPT